MQEHPWLLDNDRVNRWYYRDAPTRGSIVIYTNENYIDVVERVTLTHVWLVSGSALRRPYLLSRLVVWSYNTLTEKRTKYRASYVPKPQTDWSASIV